MSTNLSKPFEILVTVIIRYSKIQPIIKLIGRASKECAEVKKYIDTNFRESITLDQLAEMAHVNKYYLAHSFSREYNTSPINYLIERRRCESCYLLCDANYSLLTEIPNNGIFFSQLFFSKFPQGDEDKSAGISKRETR